MKASTSSLDFILQARVMPAKPPCESGGGFFGIYVPGKFLKRIEFQFAALVVEKKQRPVGPLFS